MATFYDFLNFDYFITKDVMSVIYAVGAVLIIIIGLLMMFGSAILPSEIPMNSSTAIIVGGLFLIFGNVLWRIICEFIVILFNINETLESIDITLEPDYDESEDNTKVTNTN